MLETLLIVVGLLTGFVIGQVVARRRDSLDERRVADMVSSVSLDVARRSREEMAERHLADLDQRKAVIEATVKGLTEHLDKLQRQTTELEAKRERSYGGLMEQLNKLQSSTTELSGQSRALATALRGSHQQRGRWGEVQLQNIAELAGMTEHIDFAQQTTTTEGSRPDMLVKLPGGDGIPVDSKVPLSQYLEAIECDDPDRRKALLVAHARAVKEHVRALKSRDYAGQVQGSIDFTVLFVPGDPILAAAFEADPDLQTYAMKERILIATPVTLLALLRTVGLFWQQAAQAENAKEVWETTREFRKRVGKFQEHLSKMGKGLTSAVTHFNNAVGSFERSVLPQARRVEELEDPTHAQEKLADLPPLDKAVRQITAGDASDPAEPAAALPATEDANEESV